MRKTIISFVILVISSSAVWAGCPYDHFRVGQKNGKLFVDMANSTLYCHWNADYSSNPRPYVESYYEFMSKYGGGYIRAEPGFSVTTISQYEFEGVSGIDYKIYVQRVYATTGLSLYSSLQSILEHDGDTFCLSDYDDLHVHFQYVVAENPDQHYEVQYRLIDSTGKYESSDVFSVCFGSYIPGDANKDGKVDVGDLGILAANYGTTENATWEKGDFTGEGTVDVGDLGILAANYGTNRSGEDFNKDYDKIFDTADAADIASDDEDNNGNALCSSLGFSLIAVLIGMGLLMVRDER
jgi:hypothetical protein